MSAPGVERLRLLRLAEVRERLLRRGGSREGVQHRLGDLRVRAVRRLHGVLRGLGDLAGLHGVGRELLGLGVGCLFGGLRLGVLHRRDGGDDFIFRGRFGETEGGRDFLQVHFCSFCCCCGIVGIPAARVVGVDHRLHGEIGSVGESHRAERDRRAVVRERPARRDEAVAPALDELAALRRELEVGAEAVVLHAQVLRPGRGRGAAAGRGGVVNVHEDFVFARGLPVGDHRLERGPAAVLHRAAALAAVAQRELAERRELHAHGGLRVVLGGPVEGDRVAVEDFVFHLGSFPSCSTISRSRAESSTLCAAACSAAACSAAACSAAARSAAARDESRNPPPKMPPG